MKKNNTYRLREKSSLFGLFLLISLLLHLLVGVLLQDQQIIPAPEEKPEQTSVALEERKNWLELDHLPLEKTATPPKNAAHVADANAKVEQETAPKGDESRDQQRVEKRKQQVAQQSSASLRQKTIIHPTAPSSPAPPLQADEHGSRKPATKTGQERLLEQLQVKLPTLKSLTDLSHETLARLDRQQQKQRAKDRPEIELKDDEVWLNLRQDEKLISFFRRFSDRVEAVWNYPVEASSRGIEGTLLIKIIVNKKGELLDAFPLESSGSDILDYEAITAVYRAAPFGDLPSYYQHDQLKIYAHFQYNLSRRMIYGNP
jgi:protein TonB